MAGSQTQTALLSQSSHSLFSIYFRKRHTWFHHISVVARQTASRHSYCLIKTTLIKLVSVFLSHTCIFHSLLSHSSPVITRVAALLLPFDGLSGQPWVRPCSHNSEPMSAYSFTLTQQPANWLRERQRQKRKSNKGCDGDLGMWVHRHEKASK